MAGSFLPKVRSIPACASKRLSLGRLASHWGRGVVEPDGSSPEVGGSALPDASGDGKFDLWAST
jgi:hypothetical protein